MLFELVTEHQPQQTALTLLGQARRAAHHKMQTVGPFRLEVQARILLSDVRIKRQPERAVAEAAVDFAAELDLLDFPTRGLLGVSVRLVLLLAFFALSAFINNLVLGPMFFFALILIFFFAIAIYA